MSYCYVIPCLDVTPGAPWLYIILWKGRVMPVITNAYSNDTITNLPTLETFSEAFSKKIWGARDPDAIRHFTFERRLQYIFYRHFDPSLLNGLLERAMCHGGWWHISIQYLQWPATLVRVATNSWNNHHWRINWTKIVVVSIATLKKESVCQLEIAFR